MDDQQDIRNREPHCVHQPGCSSGCRNPACRMGALWICTGCRLPIRDPVVLRVGSHQLWHTGCLCCAECHCPLQDDASCFLRDGQPFCRGDYSRKFAVRCGGCRVALCPTDLVLRAGGSIYHPTCLRCSLCNRLLMPGDCFTAGLRGLCCQAEQPTADSRIDRGGLSLEPSAGSSVGGGGWSPRRAAEDSWKGERGQRGGVRVRTVISDGQLSLLLSCYSRTPRPDAQAKLQLGHLTGLSPRVIRVWFQNKRCKDRRRLRGQDSSLGGSRSRTLRGASGPMVALSPVPADSAMQICVAESPWGLLGSQPELNRGSEHQRGSKHLPTFPKGGAPLN